MKLTIQSVPTSTSLILIPVMFESCIQSKNLTERDRVRERGAGEKILLIKKNQSCRLTSESQDIISLLLNSNLQDCNTHFYD